MFIRNLAAMASAAVLTAAALSAAAQPGPVMSPAERTIVQHVQTQTAAGLALLERVVKRSTIRRHDAPPR